MACGYNCNHLKLLVLFAHSLGKTVMTIGDNRFAGSPRYSAAFVMISAYPWGALEPVSRAAVRVAAGARQSLRAQADKAAAALSDLLELPCEIVVRRAQLARVPASTQALWLSREALSLGALVEPALAAFVAARVLRRAEPLSDPGAPLSQSLAAVLAALGVETARRCGIATVLLGAPPIGEEALSCDVTLLLDGRPYSLTVLVVGAEAAPLPEPSLAALGELTLRIPLVIGSVALDRRELLGLEPGGALLLGEGATLDASGGGFAVLVSPTSERGIRAAFQPGGRLVVGEATEARLSVEPAKPTSDGETLTDVLLETPVVVRVELGAVSMSAREWARLGPGDVIETGQRIAEPVVLRMAGREVGRGELVNVDGQVGVRIQKLYEGT
jgi:flagellar motor switch/type III secretory pathway protein FliN